jgi:hypothetical protein
MSPWIWIPLVLLAGLIFYAIVSRVSVRAEANLDLEAGTPEAAGETKSRDEQTHTSTETYRTRVVAINYYGHKPDTRTVELMTEARRQEWLDVPVESCPPLASEVELTRTIKLLPLAPETLSTSPSDQSAEARG